MDPKRHEDRWWHRNQNTTDLCLVLALSTISGGDSGPLATAFLQEVLEKVEKEPALIPCLLIIWGNPFLESHYIPHLSEGSLRQSRLLQLFMFIRSHVEKNPSALKVLIRTVMKK